MLEMELVSVTENTPSSSSVGVGLSITITNQITNSAVQYILTMNNCAVTVHVQPLGSFILNYDASRHITYAHVKKIMQRFGHRDYIRIVAQGILGWLATVAGDNLAHEMQCDSFSGEHWAFLADAVHYIASCNYVELTDPKRYASFMHKLSKSCEPVIICIIDPTIYIDDPVVLLGTVPLGMATTSKSVFVARDDPNQYDRVYELTSHMCINRTTDCPQTTIYVEMEKL